MAAGNVVRGPVCVLPLSAGAALPLVEGPGEARAVLYPAVGARERAFHHLILHPGGRTVILSHPAAEAVYFVVSGNGAAIDHDTGERVDLAAGHMFFVDIATRYQLVAGDAALILVGGPCPPDPDLYRHLA